jgi:hypothetical protein
VKTALPDITFFFFMSSHSPTQLSLASTFPVCKQCTTVDYTTRDIGREHSIYENNPELSSEAENLLHTYPRFDLLARGMELC